MHDFSRRDVLRLAGAAALAGPMATGRAFAQDRAKELNILCWEGYNSAQVLDPFRTQHGANVQGGIAHQRPHDDQPPARRRDQRLGSHQRQQPVGAQDHAARRARSSRSTAAKFEPYFEKMLPDFKPPYRWAMSEDGKELIGMAQRFGPYSFVVNTDKVSRDDRRGPGLGSLERPGQRRQVRHPGIRRLERLLHLHDRRHRPVQGAHARTR